MEEPQLLREWRPQGQEAVEAGQDAEPLRRRTVDDQIAAHREALRKLEARKRKDARNARTRRLLGLGAAVEEAMEPELSAHGMSLADEDVRRELAKWLASVPAGSSLTCGALVADDVARMVGLARTAETLGWGTRP